MPRSRHIPAFTLLEVLIATAIVSMLAAALGASLHVAFRARRSATDTLGTVRAARLAIDAIGRDLRSALPPRLPPPVPTPPGTLTLAGPFEGTDGSGPTFAVGLPGSPGSPGAAGNTVGSGGVGVTFSNTADPTRTAEAAGDVEEVTLTIVAEAELQLGATSGATTPGGRPAASVMPPAEPPAPDERVLVRRVTRNLLAATDQQPVDQVLCRHVRSFSLQYFDGAQWTSTWDSTLQGTTQYNALPAAVQVALEIAATDAGSRGRPPSYNLVRVFSLPCARPASTGTAGTQTPGTP